MWIETETSGFLNLDCVELVFEDGDVLLARLVSGAEVKVTTTEVGDAVELLRRHLVGTAGDAPAIPSASFRSPPPEEAVDAPHG